MSDYFSMDKDIYIVNDQNNESIFIVKDYNHIEIGKFYIENSDKKNITFYYETTNLQDIKMYQAINLFSEILYFKGKKEKNVICIGELLEENAKKIGFIKNKDYYIKSIYKFEKERKKKFDSIDDLYSKPYLVPWNLVEREWDVINIVKEKVDKESTILEIGSGYGKNLMLLDSIGYVNATGIEYSKNACNIANNFEYNQIHNKYGSILSSSFKDNQFDSIIDIGCLHCIDSNNKKDAIEEIKRILKKNGILISRYFLPKDEAWISRYPVKINKFGNTKEELENYLKEYFNIEKIYEENQCVYIIGRVKK